MAQNQFGFCDKGRFIIDPNKSMRGSVLPPVEIDFQSALAEDFESRA
jgi:hypothetical protein